MIRKSQIASFICTLIFGPLGVLYSSIWIGCVVVAFYIVGAGVFLGVDTSSASSSLANAGMSIIGQFGFGGLLAWCVPILIGAAVVKYHNEDVAEYEAVIDGRHRELLQALQRQRRI